MCDKEGEVVRGEAGGHGAAKFVVGLRPCLMGFLLVFPVLLLSQRSTLLNNSSSM